jgi:hypothetical protein
MIAISWDEKLGIFVEFKMRSFGLTPQDDRKRLNGKH